MRQALKPVQPRKRASVSDAKLAYFDGDFERCLALCAQVRRRSRAIASEVVLLTARALLRTGCAAEAQATLGNTNITHVSLDATLTAEMLLGAARIRQGDPDGGITLLVAAAKYANNAHFAIRSEIAFSTALGYWAKRDIDAAEFYLAQVDPRSDIIHARALELQAWCHDARGQHRRAAEGFISTLQRLDTCQAQDLAITATALCSLSIFAAELWDAELAAALEGRLKRMQWTSGLATQRFLTTVYQALYAELNGNTVESYELAIRSRELAPTVTHEVIACALYADLARNAGETLSSMVHAKRARQTLRTVDLNKLVGEERLSILVLAESSAPFDLGAAEALLARYRELVPGDRMNALTGDPRLSGQEIFAAGVIAQARGDRKSAQELYRRAFDIFEPIGYVRRALIAACALVGLADDDDAGRYIAEHTAGAGNFITRQLRPDPAELVAANVEHPVFAALPPRQREVVALVCKGKTNLEIAASQQVVEQTVKNMLTQKIFRKFGVTSRAALVSACLGAPAPHASAPHASAPHASAPHAPAPILRSRSL